MLPQHTAQRTVLIAAAALALALTGGATASPQFDDDNLHPVEAGLDRLWRKASSDFGSSLAGNAHQYYSSVQTGTRSSSHPGTPPTPTTGESYDDNQRVLLTAENADAQMNAANTIASSYVKAIQQGVLDDSKNISKLFADGMQQPYDSFTDFIKQYSADMLLLAGDGGVLEGGGGYGFGFSVQDCNKNVVLTVNGAISWGYKAVVEESSIYPSIDAGIFGGATINMATPSADGLSVQRVLDSGGGGGGSLTARNNVYKPNYTASPNDFQIVSHTLDEVFEMTHGAACAPLSIVGGGGGGGGFMSQNPDDPSQNLHYGASAAYTYATDGATGLSHLNVTSSVDRVVTNGDDDDGSGGDPSGSPIGKVIAACRQQCLAGNVPGGNFLGCFCPCVKAGVAKQHLQWPHKIVCTPPSLF